MCEQASVLPPADLAIAARTAQDLATHWQGVADRQREEIDQAREILHAVPGETLVAAAAALSREYETTNESYCIIHEYYWKRAIPFLRALLDMVEHGGDAAPLIRSHLDHDLIPRHGACVSSHQATTATGADEETQPVFPGEGHAPATRTQARREGR